MNKQYLTGQWSDKELSIMKEHLYSEPADITKALAEAGYNRKRVDVSKKVRRYINKNLPKCASPGYRKPVERISHKERKQIRDEQAVDVLYDRLLRSCEAAKLSPRLLATVLWKAYKHYRMLSKPNVSRHLF